MCSADRVENHFVIWIAQKLGVVDPALYGNAIAGLFGFFGS